MTRWVSSLDLQLLLKDLIPGLARLKCVPLVVMARLYMTRRMRLFLTVQLVITVTIGPGRCWTRTRRLSMPNCLTFPVVILLLLTQLLPLWTRRLFLE